MNILDETGQQFKGYLLEIGFFDVVLHTRPAIAPGEPRAVGEDQEVVERLSPWIIAQEQCNASAGLLKLGRSNSRLVARIGPGRANQRHNDHAPILDEDLHRLPPIACRVRDSARL